MSKKLAAKNALIEVPVSQKSPPTHIEDTPSRPRTRTAVGGMAQFVATQSPLHREVEALRGVVKSFDGALLTRALDPASIVPSSWANRHVDAFATSDFAELKREIKDAGGNVQPIKVRPLIPSTQGAGPGAKYEIVFGHRRHRACLELGIEVNAVIEELDDRKLFEQMERENRGRKNLSAWEQGGMYLTALDQGLYASLRKLSESIGVDVSLISKSVALARLPRAIIDAFPSPLDIQFRWAQPLGVALQKDPEGLLEKAKQIRTVKDGPKTAIDIFTHLTKHELPEATTSSNTINMAGTQIGKFSVDKKGVLTLKIDGYVLTQDRCKDFKKMIEDFFQQN